MTMKKQLTEFSKYIYDTYHGDTFKGKYYDQVLQEESDAWFGFTLIDHDMVEVKKLIKKLTDQEQQIETSNI